MKMKKMVSTLLAAVLCLQLALGLSQPAYGLGSDPQALKVYYHGFLASETAYPRGANGEVLVPIHAIAKAMGRSCDWGEEERLFTVSSYGSRVEIYSGGETVERIDRSGNYLQIAMSAPAKHYGDEMLVPLDGVKIILGLEARWDEKTRSVRVGAEELELVSRPGWRALVGHPYDGFYTITFTVKGTGTLLDYDIEVKELGDGKLGEKFTFTTLEGRRETRTRGDWYRYFGSQSVTVSETQLCERFGSFYTDWKDFYRRMDPYGETQKYLERVYGPFEEDLEDEVESSWCLAAYFESENLLYTGYTRYGRDEEEPDDGYDGWWRDE